MYEAREEKRVFREIVERMGYNPDDAYPKSNYDQWLGYFLGMRVLNEDATKWEPVITWTEADNEKYHASYPAQEGKVALRPVHGRRKLRGGALGGRSAQLRGLP